MVWQGSVAIWAQVKFKAQAKAACCAQKSEDTQCNGYDNKLDAAHDAYAVCFVGLVLDRIPQAYVWSGHTEVPPFSALEHCTPT